MSCEAYDIILDCKDDRILSKVPGNESLLNEGKVAEAKLACKQKLQQERSCNRGGKRRRRKSRRSRKSKRKSRRKKRRKSKKRKTRRRRRRRK